MTDPGHDQNDLEHDGVRPEHPDDAPMFRLEGVHKGFDTLRVLRGVDLSIKRGRTTVIIGPSGTGKSVLLKLLVGLLKPDSGKVYFENRRMDLLTPGDMVEVRKKIGFLFQMGALFDSMTVGDNICFPLAEHTSLDRAARKQRCCDVLRLVGLDDVGNKMPGDLSGGQKKRVALARAIVLEPSVVLYDEPTTGLDPIRADVINELIIALNKRMGITSIVVTHDMASANKIADRMIMLYDGHIVADAEPEDFRRSEDDLVQRFIHGQADQADLERIRNVFDPAAAGGA